MKNLIILFLLLFLCSCEKRECLKSHSEMRRRAAWTQFIYVNKMMVPIVHPAKDYIETVCDEYAQEVK